LIYLAAAALLEWKSIGQSKNRKYLALAPALMVNLLIGLSALYMLASLHMIYFPRRFDQLKWTQDIHNRWKMSVHIQTSKMLIGKTKAEVLEILGGVFYEYAENHIAYYLGFKRWIDPDVLDIYFEEGIVVKTGQHTT
jgi:hypothetical protein